MPTSRALLRTTCCTTGLWVVLYITSRLLLYSYTVVLLCCVRYGELLIAAKLMFLLHIIFTTTHYYFHHYTHTLISITTTNYTQCTHTPHSTLPSYTSIHCNHNHPREVMPPRTRRGRQHWRRWSWMNGCRGGLCRWGWCRARNHHTSWPSLGARWLSLREGMPRHLTVSMYLQYLPLFCVSVNLPN